MPQLDQPRGLDPGRIPPVQLRQRPSPPERQRVRQNHRGALGLVGRQQLAGTPHRPLEPLGVDLVERNRKPVTERQGLDRAAAENLAEPDHTALHHLRPSRRHPVAPQHVGQHLRADHLSGMHGQSGEYDAITSSENLLLPLDRERAENGDTHASTLDPVARRSRAALPA